MMTDESEASRGREADLRNTPLAIAVEQRGPATVVGLSGSCTMTESERLGRRLTELAVDAAGGPFIIDLSGLDFIDSIGIGGIVAAYLHCRRRQTELRLVRPQSEIARMFELSKLTRIFQIFPSVEAALRSEAHF